MGRALLVAAAFLASLGAAPAEAATVHVASAPDPRYPAHAPYSLGAPAVFFIAGPGERNRVLVSYTRDSRVVVVEDPGAVIEPRDGCIREHEHRALCRARAEDDQWSLQQAVVDLGDLDDEVRTSRPGPYPIGGVAAWGGPGDDLLDGGEGPDQLVGGDGRDTLLGGAYADVLVDGVTTGAAGPDVLDGGSQRDTVAYTGRRRDVFVDVSDPRAPAGERGERDVLRSVEDVAGGHGDDVLRGDDDVNWMYGGPGDDVLSARGGDDFLYGEAGSDRLVAGSGDDHLAGGRAADSFSCGADGDVVIGPSADELIQRPCESLSFERGDNTNAFDPFPSLRSPTSVGFRMRCPFSEGYYVSCRIGFTLRETGGAHRVLGRGRLANAVRAPVPTIMVALTPTGRRLAARPGGVTATATAILVRTADGRWLPPRMSWAFTLRTR